MQQLQTIRTSIRETVTKSQLVSSIFTGGFKREQYIAYLVDVYHYATHSAVVIGQAGCRLIHSHPALAEYLLKHATEEMGHEKWAQSDLYDLGLTERELKSSSPSRPCRDMIAHEYYYAFHGNAVGLFGWMYTLESLGGDEGSALANAISKALALNGKGTKFLGGHGEADTYHSVDLSKMIQEHIVRSEDILAFQQMAEVSRDCYGGMMQSALKAIR